MNRLVLCTVGSALLALMGTSAVGQDQWPRFRGPHAGAVADDPALPDAWSETDNIVWKIDIPGQSWSSPVVWGNHVFVTSAVSAGDEPAPVPGLYEEGHDFGGIKTSEQHRWVVYDVDFATGNLNWERQLHRANPPFAKHIKNTYATETPVTDGRHLYVYFGSIGLVGALSMSGETVWTTKVDVFETRWQYGPAASPALHDDRLYILNDNATGTFLVAFDTETGEEIWRVLREEHGGANWSRSWSTPFVWENELRTEIVTAGAAGVRSYDLDGNLLWQIDGMSSMTVPTPFAKHGLVYISAGYPGGALRPVYAVRPGASGDITLWEKGGPSTAFPGPLRSSEHIAWSYPLLGPYSVSTLVYGDYHYTLLDRGFLLCHDARTGEEIYGRQRIEIGNGFTASPWGYNGKIFLLSEDGDTFVVQAGPEFKILGKNALDEMSLATPAVVRGSVILRTQSKLYRIARGTQR